MAALSDYLENKFLNHALGNAAFTQPPGLRIALFNVVPAEDGTGALEITGSGYSRQTITFNTATGGTATNSSTHTWANASGSNWVINAIGIYDTAGTPNLLFKGVIAGAPKTINDGDTFTINVSQLTIALD